MLKMRPQRGDFQQGGAKPNPVGVSVMVRHIGSFLKSVFPERLSPSHQAGTGNQPGGAQAPVWASERVESTISPDPHPYPSPGEIVGKCASGSAILTGGCHV